MSCNRCHENSCVGRPEPPIIRHLGRPGYGPQEVSAPHGIAIDSQGRLFIGDRDNNRILIWDQDGNHIDQWKQCGRPSGIYISKDDTIHVADSESWRPDNPGWKKDFRIGGARSGVLHYFLEDIESMDFVHSGAEGVGLDAMGNICGAVVRRRMLERHEPPVPQPTRAATGRTDRRRAGATGRQVRRGRARHFEVPFPPGGSLITSPCDAVVAYVESRPGGSTVGRAMGTSVGGARA